MASPQLDPETIMEWLQASCAAQGVPVVIRDHAVISQVATLLGNVDTHPACTPDNRKTAPATRAPVIPQKTGACQTNPAEPRQQPGRLDHAS